VLEREALLAEAERELLYNTLESIQYEVGSDEDWTVDSLVERGILGPVRGLLLRGDFEDIRLSVLQPDEDDDDHFVMRWAAGHRPESVKRYRRPIDTTLAGRAFKSGDFFLSPNVAQEEHFIRNPNATRDFTTLVSVPLRVGDKVVGVFNVVSTAEDAFSESDISFIKVVGAVLDVILAEERNAGLWEQAVEEAKDRGGKGAQGVEPPEEA